MLFVQSMPVYSQSVEGDFIDLENNETPLGSYLGQYVVLDAFATWCGPCELMMPHLEDVYDTLKGNNGTVLSISMDKKSDTIDKVEQFKNRFDAEWTFGFDKYGNLNNTFTEAGHPIVGYPTTLVISPDGEIIKEWRGVTDSETILEYLDQYLDLPGSLGRAIDLTDLLVQLYNSPMFYFFLIMVWGLIFYSVYRLIDLKREMNKKGTEY